jgi:hypothetical protein
MTNQSWIKFGVSALALAVVGTLGMWAYNEAQRREVQRQVAALAQDSTDRLRETLGLLSAGAEARPTLEAHFAALEDAVQATRRLDASVDPGLVSAATAYVTDVHALLRRAVALHAGRDAVRSEIGAINSHLRAAGTRSTDWISQALALQQRLSSSFLDYRLAAGGLEKSLTSLRDTSQNLRSFVPPAAVIEAEQLSSAEKRVAELTAQLEPEIENAKRLPAG